MRADRLLSILMLLQTHGRMSAPALAAELEVSPRTIYRDICALSTAGVPVYSETGRDGGFSLIDSYRTNLTGLNARELRALILLDNPTPLNELGLGQDLQAALRKLAAAQPETQLQAETKVRARFHLDSTWQEADQGPLPYLRIIEQAVWADRMLVIRYMPLFTTEMVQEVAPYGLVAKAGVWYLVCERAGRMAVHRVSDLWEARLADGQFERAADFDLAAFWKQWWTRRAQNRSNFKATVRISPALIPYLTYYFGVHLQSEIDQAAPDAGGWITLILAFENFEAARARLLGFGGAVEVVAPFSLRTSVIDFAGQTLACYGIDL